MIESGFLKSTEECIQFTMGYQIGEKERTKLYKYTDFLMREQTLFKIGLIDYGSYAFAHIILIDEFRQNYVIVDDSHSKCIQTSSSRMMYDILDYGTVDNYLNTIKGYILRDGELIQSFEIYVRKRG